MTELLGVTPTNYRRIALHAIGLAKRPVVLMDHGRVHDFSETGPLTQRGIRESRDFEILDDQEPILGFHDHPDEMWIAAGYRELAEYCATQGWLRIE